MILLMLAGGLSFVAFGIDQTQKSNYIIGASRRTRQRYTPRVVEDESPPLLVVQASSCSALWCSTAT